MFKSDFEHLKPLLHYAQQRPLDATWQADQTRQLNWLCQQARYRHLPANNDQETLQLGGQLGQGSLRLLRIVAESLQALSTGQPQDALARLQESLELPGFSDPWFSDPFDGEAYRLGMQLARAQADASLEARFAAHYRTSRQQVGRVQAVQALMTQHVDELASDLADALSAGGLSGRGLSSQESSTTTLLDEAANTNPDPADSLQLIGDRAYQQRRYQTDGASLADAYEQAHDFIPPVANAHSYTSISALGDLSVPLKVFRRNPAEVLEFDTFLLDDIYFIKRPQSLILDILLEPRERAEAFLFDARAHIDGARLLNKAQAPLTFDSKAVLACEGAGARLRLKLRAPVSWQDFNGLFDGVAFWQQLAQIVLLTA